MRIPAILVALALLFPCAQVSAQEAPPPAVSPHTRIMAARSIFIQPAAASIPYDIIGHAFQGWGRYQLADTPAAADLIVSIRAPLSNAGGISVGSGADSRAVTSPGVTQIRLLILDAHDRAVLWSGSEQPKSSMHEKKYEDQLVDASLRLFRRFRNTIQPEP